MLRQLAPSLFVADHAFSIFGLALNGRMTVVRLTDGSLWVHSPIPLDAPSSETSLRAELAALGPVRYLVAPNLMHHLHLGPAMEAFPKAEVWAAPGLAGKRKDLKLPNTLGANSGEAGELPPWEQDIAQVTLQGTAPKLSETLFFHRESRSLLVTDMAFHFLEADNWMTRTYLKLTGAYGKLGITPVTRSMIGDRRKLKAELQQVEGWDFDRIVVCHGQVLEKGGKAALKEAYAWL